MKLNAADIKRFLAKTGLFSELQLKEPIRQIKVSQPFPDTTLIAFVWNSVLMGLLFDENAGAHEEVLQQVRSWGRPARILTPTDSDNGHFMHDSKVVYLITTASEKQRLDQRLAEIEPIYSRSQLAKFIKNGQVTVNGTIVKKVKQLVSDGDAIKLTPPQKATHNFPILFENETILAIDKPAGVLSHSINPTNPEWTIDDFAKAKSQIVISDRAIAHRLDRDTSGVILAAKNDANLHWLQQQFNERKIQKTYYAVVDKKPSHQKAIIDLPIRRSNTSSGRFEVNPNGREAITEMRILKQLGKRFLLELKPITGRTHQLRVHLSYIGCPIMGDKLYGGNKHSRLMLHAGRIKLTDQDGNTIDIKSPIPSEFKS
ncbi:MAG: RluA family pseudouridine synthase [Candidatus Nanosyncoccaceae bacterium]|jgi:23S rRNA pseudouridine1911/1915/1917 synthase